MVTFSQLINSVRLRTDIVNSLFVTDIEIGEYLNSSLAELYGIIVNTFNDYYVKTIQFTLTSADDGYLLPSDFFKEIRIDKSYSGNPSATQPDYIKLNRINIADENNFNYMTLRNIYSPPTFGYIMYNDKIKIIPKSNIAGSYQLLYVPAYVDYTSNDTVCMGPPGQKWHEYALVDTCIKVMSKEESDPSMFIAQKAELKQRIQTEAANRIANDALPPTTTTLKWYDRNSGWGGGW